MSSGEVGWFFKLIASFGHAEFVGSRILGSELNLLLFVGNLISFEFENVSKAKRVLFLGSSLFKGRRLQLDCGSRMLVALEKAPALAMCG